MYSMNESTKDSERLGNISQNFVISSHYPFKCRKTQFDMKSNLVESDDSPNNTDTKVGAFYIACFCYSVDIARHQNEFGVHFPQQSAK